MTIMEVKAQVATEQKIVIDNLMLQQQESENPEGADKPKIKDPWVYYWDNTNRVKISMHFDVFTKLQADKERRDLLLKAPKVEPAKEGKAAYTHYTVFIPSSVLATF